MSVPEQTPYKEYTANGSTASFALGFICDSKNDLIVLVDNVAPPVAAWSLVGNNAVFTTAPASGKKIILQRNTAMSRTTNYQSNNNSFRPETINKDIDRVWLKLQELGVADMLLKIYVDRLHGEQKDYIDNKDQLVRNIISDLRNYVNQQDNSLAQSISNLRNHTDQIHSEQKNYIDQQDNQRNSYFENLISQQGVALDQLDDYYNYLMQRLAQIAVDKGWDASFVVDGDKTQKQINASLNKDSSLSIESGFSKNNADKVVSFLEFNKMMAKFQPGAEISIEKPVVVELAGTKSTEIDLQGATLNFKTGGKLTFKGKSTPYLTTNATTDLIRCGTNFKVSSIAGIAIGDLIVVKSPAVLVTGVTLSQTYLVQGVDAATNTIFVMGYIVGDMRADQITSQGLTGNITVECYKLANFIKIRNGKITSINRDDETTEILIDGFRYVDVTGLSPDKPTRTGVNFNYCGVVNIDKCFSIDAGYVANDQGYNLVPTSPAGLSYGYGFLASYCYCVNFVNNHVLAGWHGLDVARGVTFAIAMNNTLHKGAFGLSSHEGQWAFFMQGNTVLGGHALTCRSMELTFKDNTCRGIKERLLIGVGRMQSLVIDDNDIELSTEFPSNWVYFINGYNASCYSNAKPIAIVSDNNIRGISTSTVLTVAKNVKLTGNDFGYAGVNIQLTALDAGGDLVLEDNKHNGVVAQSVYNLTTNFGSITIDGEVDRTTATLSNSAMIYMSAACPKINMLANTTTDKEFIVRNVGNVSLNFDKVIQNKALGGRILNWTSTGTVVDKFIANIERDTLPAANTVTYNTRLRNVFLNKTYSVSKTQDWPSLANNLQQSTTVSISGAAIGDKVQATMDIPLQGTRIWAEVTGANLVTVYQSNNTGATVDLPSGALTIELI